MISTEKVEGKRFVSEEHIGTIKFYGTIEGKQGLWYGVEWDDQKRGKHSGSVGDISYFTTQFENAGSFISVKRDIDFGQGFVEALRKKYLSIASSAPIDIGTTKEVEMIGWKKMESKLSQLHCLKEVGLSNMRVVGGDPDGLIQSSCPSVSDLDLSKNLFTCLSDVARICQELRNLEILRLNNNRFVVPSNLDQNAFRTVKVVTVMSTFMAWSDYILLASYFPVLGELHLGFNRISSISNMKPFSSIKLLNLEHNLLQDWESIELFGTLDSLEHLNLADNQIRNVLPPKTKFTSLKVLNINRNKLASWKDVHQLNDFPALVEIRLTGNPICETISSGKSAILIGRLKNLVRLNGTNINGKLRRDSECYYLNLAHKDLSLENFTDLHPRYQELCEIHGVPVDAKLEITVADRLILVQIFNPHTGAFQEKKIPKQTNIRSFKTIIARTLWPTDWQKVIRGNLIWTNSGDGLHLQDELKPLDFYGITNNDCFRLDF
jgi:tubulin-specific chaperone E